MERLQLYISKSLRGFKTLTHINGTETTRRHLRDLRQALETVAYDSAEKCVFYLLQYVEGATFFTILRTIPDKALDHLAATIAIPEGLEISADDLYRVIREVTRKVSNPGMNSEDIAALRALFAREFPSAQGAARQIPTEGRSFAGRYFGGESGLTLRDFLGDNLYQPMFTAFAGVVLVDAGLPFKITGTDLSDQPLARIVTIMPPKRVPDYTPHLFHRVFDRPFKVALGSEVDIIWRRAGFEEIVQKVTIDADGLRPDPVTTDESRKVISPASFFVTSRTSNEQLPQVTIRVNDVEILDRHSFTQSELENAHVSVTAPGFHPYNGRLDLASTTQALIELAERGKSSSSSTPATDPAMMRQAAEATRRINSNYSRNSDGKKWWMKLLLMLGGVIAALAVCMLLFPELFGDTSKEPVIPEKSVSDSVAPSASIAAMKMQADEPATEESPAAENTAEAGTPAKDPAKATAFLDDKANGWWSEKALSEYPELAGLYNDLNNYNFDALINTWPKRLPDCEWVRTIATHASNARAKKLNPKTGNHAPQYTASGRIHRREYINWIDRSQK
ncbi:MAG: hypothetical protein K2I56_00250 [Muribaculaceae bacterium]|nr:hypothetical protein [Muribaculaceae bacterium]